MTQKMKFYSVRNYYNNTRKNYQINKPQVQAQQFRLRENRLLKPAPKIEKIEIEKVEHLEEDHFRLTKKSMKAGIHGPESVGPKRNSKSQSGSGPSKFWKSRSNSDRPGCTWIPWWSWRERRKRKWTEKKFQKFKKQMFKYSTKITIFSVRHPVLPGPSASSDRPGRLWTIIRA